MNLFSQEDIEEIGEAENRIKLERGDSKIDLTDAEELFSFLKHGDEKHQAWLRRAIYAWAVDAKRPRLA